MRHCPMTTMMPAAAARPRRRRRRRRRRPLSFLLLQLYLLLLLLSALAPTAPGAAAAATATDPNEEDYYWDIQPYTELYNFISQRKWSRALQALRDDPDEASVLVVVRRGGGSGGNRGGNRGRGGNGRGAVSISERVLPIHKLFAIDGTDDARSYDLPPPPSAGSADNANTTNSATSSGMPPDQIQLALELLRHHPLGARMVDHDGRLALHLAAYSVVSPPAEVIRALLEAYNHGNDSSGSNAKRTLGGTDLHDAEGLTPLHAACSAPISTFDAISTLLQANPAAVSTPTTTTNNNRENNNHDDDNNDAALPLHYAAWGGSRHPSAEMQQIFQLLVSSYEEGLVQRDGDGDTPLDIMVKYGRTDLGVFEYVVDVVKDRLGGLRKMTATLEGAPADEAKDNANNDKDDKSDGREDDGEEEEGGNAIDNNNNNNNNSNRNSSRHRGNTLLHNAVSMAPHRLTTGMVRILLDTEPQLAQSFNDDGQLPLHSALEHAGSSAQVIQMLLEAFEDGVRVEDGRTGRLPLHMACSQGVPDVHAVQLLVEAYPAAVLMLDGDDGEEGRLPLHLALSAPQRGGNGANTNTNNDGVVEYLLESGPSASATVDDKTGVYPLHMAIQRHRSSAVVEAMLGAYPEAAVELVGADQSTTALHMLASVQDRYTPGEAVDIAQAILEVKPESVQILDGSGRLPLHLACDTSDDGGRGKSQMTTKKKKMPNKKKPAPTSTLVGILLDAYQDGARVKDSDGNLPLHYAVAAFDADATMRLLEVYEDGAKHKERPVLHIACGSLKTAYEPYSGEKDAADRILKRLLSLFPDAAAIPGDDGKLPLSILLDRPNILEHIEPTTFKSLLDANPEAARHRVDEVGDYPLQTAIGNMRNSKDSGRNLELVELLMETYPDVVREKNDRGVALLQQVLTQAHGTARQSDGSTILGQLARRLYELYPEAISIVDPSGHYPLHSLARIMGQTAGSSSRVLIWAPLFSDVLDANSTLTDVSDNKGRPPLHILCFHLGDAAYDNEDGNQYERSAEFNSAVRALIAKSLNVLRLEDKDGQSPIDLLNRELKGRSSTKLSQTLQFVKEEIKEARKKVPRKIADEATDATKDEL